MAGWIGGTPVGDALAGGAGGFAEGLFRGKSDEELLEAMAKGTWEGVKHANPGLDFLGEMIEGFVAGESIEHAFLEAAKKMGPQIVDQYGFDRKTTEELFDIGIDTADGLFQGKNIGEVAYEIAKDKAYEAAKDDSALHTEKSSNPLTIDTEQPGQSPATNPVGASNGGMKILTPEESLAATKDDLQNALETARKEQGEVGSATDALNKAMQSGNQQAVESATERLNREKAELEQATDAVDEALGTYREAKEDVADSKKMFADVHSAKVDALKDHLANDDADSLFGSPNTATAGSDVADAGIIIVGGKDPGALIAPVPSAQFDEFADFMAAVHTASASKSSAHVAIDSLVEYGVAQPDIDFGGLSIPDTGFDLDFAGGMESTLLPPAKEPVIW
jgi:hypothetical protein